VLAPRGLLAFFGPLEVRTRRSGGGTSCPAPPCPSSSEAVRARRRRCVGPGPGCGEEVVEVCGLVERALVVVRARIRLEIDHREGHLAQDRMPCAISTPPPAPTWMSYAICESTPRDFAASMSAPRRPPLSGNIRRMCSAACHSHRRVCDRFCSHAQRSARRITQRRVSGAQEHHRTITNPAAAHATHLLHKHTTLEPLLLLPDIL
jgi:hypothetical protein